MTQLSKKITTQVFHQFRASSKKIQAKFLSMQIQPTLNPTKKNSKENQKLENVAAFVRFQNKESSIKMFQFLRKILFEPKNAVSVPEKSFFKKFLVLQKKKINRPMVTFRVFFVE